MMGDAKNAVLLQFRSFFSRCKFHQLQKQQELQFSLSLSSSSDNLGKLQISTHDRRIAFFFNPLKLAEGCIFTGILAYMPKSQRISDNQCLLPPWHNVIVFLFCGQVLFKVGFSALNFRLDLLHFCLKCNTFIPKWLKMI